MYTHKTRYGPEQFIYSSRVVGFYNRSNAEATFFIAQESKRI